MNSLVESKVAAWFVDHPATIGNVVVLAMHIVEEYSATVHAMHGSDKLEAAKALFKNIINEAVIQNCISRDTANHLNSYADQFESIVEAVMTVAHNPQLVQMAEKVKNCCVARRKPAKGAKVEVWVRN